MGDCPFCLLPQNMWAKETIFYMDDLLVVMRAKDLKGHKERLVAVVHSHQDFNPYLEAYLMAKLIETGRSAFRQDFVVLRDTFSRFAGHAHMIACLEDPEAEDYKQVLGTERLKVHV